MEKVALKYEPSMVKDEGENASVKKNEEPPRGRAEGSARMECKIGSGMKGEREKQGGGEKTQAKEERGKGGMEGKTDLQFTPLSHLARSFSTQKA